MLRTCVAIAIAMTNNFSKIVPDLRNHIHCLENYRIISPCLQYAYAMPTIPARNLVTLTDYEGDNIDAKNYASDTRQMAFESIDR